MPKILSAKPVKEHFTTILTDKIANLKNNGASPYLKVVLVGKHGPSLIYTRNKKKFIEKIGGQCDIEQLPENISEKDFLDKIKNHNKDSQINGILIQLPLPKHLNHINTHSLVDKEKDVDGFHPINYLNTILTKDWEQKLIPCTPKGILRLFQFYNIDIAKKHMVVLGRSHIVGRPISFLGTSLDATVTLCHSKTQNLKDITKAADIIILAIGKKKFLTPEYIGDKKPIIIDVGIHSDEEGICGDADYPSLVDLVSMITPVPGGIGPLTILSVAENLIIASSRTL